LFHNNTGLGNYARTLVKDLHELYPQHEYHLFTPRISNHSFARYFLENNFIIHTAPVFSINGFWRSIGMSRKINSLNLDIYHGLSHEIPFNIGPNTKKVVSIHDLIYEISPSLFPKSDGMLYKIKYRSSCKRADSIVAISKSTQKDLSAIYGLSNNVNVLYQSCGENLQHEPLNFPTKKHFLYVGSINKRKGLLQIVKAYAKLSPEYQLPFVVIGEGGVYKEEVIIEIKNLNLESKFIFVGNVDNEGLIRYYDDSLCLVLPSLYEGFGIPVIESLFRKRPVITSKTSSLPEACGPGGLTINPTNIDELAAAMQKMFEPKVWEELSEKGHKYVEVNFSKAATTHKLIDYYQSLV
jgi:glycosyltransferase involved in cell wall biosynthesis